jgi:hypothetical protein
MKTICKILARIERDERLRRIRSRLAAKVIYHANAGSLRPR